MFVNHTKKFLYHFLRNLVYDLSVLMETKFELLPLVWWQNPWTVLIVGLGSCIGVVFLLVAWYCYKRIYGESESQCTVRRLGLLRRMPLDTIDEQKLFYDALSCLLKEYAGLLVQRVTPAMTDEESLQLLRHAQIPPELMQSIAKNLQQAVTVKFSRSLHDATCIRNDFQACVMLMRSNMHLFEKHTA